MEHVIVEGISENAARIPQSMRAQQIHKTAAAIGKNSLDFC